MTAPHQTLSDFRPNPLWSELPLFDRTGWKCVAFGAFAESSDVTGTKLRYRKRDILFGRRRAYQRRLAVSKFDGINSADAMVVRTRPGKMLPAILPFLMMSDRYKNRAVAAVTELFDKADGYIRKSN